MHLHWERSHNTAGDCNIRSLSWMGRVPDELPTVRKHFLAVSSWMFLNVEHTLGQKSIQGVSNVNIVNFSIEACLLFNF